jgi:hypothetical protein
MCYTCKAYVHKFVCFTLVNIFFLKNRGPNQQLRRVEGNLYLFPTCDSYQPHFESREAKAQSSLPRVSGKVGLWQPSNMSAEALLLTTALHGLPLSAGLTTEERGYSSQDFWAYWHHHISIWVPFHSMIPPCPVAKKAPNPSFSPWLWGIWLFVACFPCT